MRVLVTPRALIVFVFSVGATAATGCGGNSPSVYTRTVSTDMGLPGSGPGDLGSPDRDGATSPMLQPTSEEATSTQKEE